MKHTLKIVRRGTRKKQYLRDFFLAYTALFCVTCLIVFLWYIIPRRTFIYNGNGWQQHYKALVYYAKYLRSIIRNLFYDHCLVFPQWDFSLGEGNDILSTLHYYVIGDPFTLLSVFVPTRFMWVYYVVMVLLRLYLSGVAFSCLCFYTQEDKGRLAVLAGSMAYAFCYWAILNSARHPYFLNPMVYFPMIILGIERIIKKNKPWIFTLFVFFEHN